LYTCGPRHSGHRGRCGYGGRGRSGKLGIPQQQHAADGLDALVDRGLDGGIGGDVGALRIDRDGAREEEQPHLHTHENAYDEHEAVEERLILVAQRRSPR
jgi:hypothetical protein